MYKLEGRYYKINFSNGDEISLNIKHKISNGSKMEFLYHKNKTSNLLYKYTKNNQVKLKSKKELNNLLYNFCNYYNLNYPKLVLLKRVWSYNNKFSLTKNELYTKDIWIAHLNRKFLNELLKNHNINTKTIHKINYRFTGINGTGKNRQEAIKDLHTQMKSEYNHSNLSKYIKKEVLFKIFYTT